MIARFQREGEIIWGLVLSMYRSIVRDSETGILYIVMERLEALILPSFSVNVACRWESPTTWFGTYAGAPEGA